VAQFRCLPNRAEVHREYHAGLWLLLPQ
jgi:hypothetical protein